MLFFGALFSYLGSAPLLWASGETTISDKDKKPHPPGYQPKGLFDWIIGIPCFLATLGAMIFIVSQVP